MIDEIFGTRISCIETRHMPPFIAIPTCRDVCRTCLSSFSLALFERADLYLRLRTSSNLHLCVFPAACNYISPTSSLILCCRLPSASTHASALKVATKLSCLASVRRPIAITTSGINAPSKLGHSIRLAVKHILPCLLRPRKPRSPQQEVALGRP